MQVNPNPNFQVGKFQLDRSQVNPDTIRDIANNAAGVPVDGNDTDWKALADRVAKTDKVSDADLESLENLNKSAWTERKSVFQQYKASGFKDQKLAAQLADINVFTFPMVRVEDGLKVATAKAAVAAVAGADFGPANLVAAYATYGHLTDEALKDLVDELKDVEGPKPHTLFTGNKVKEVHQEAIWTEMNHMLDTAADAAKKGKPVEIDAQYYELTSPDVVGRLADAAQAGNKVRINVDPGRLVAFKGNRVELDDVPDKLRNILALSKVKGDIGVSAYPIVKVLGDPNDLMHRKLLRVGDTALLSGMNANAGSGENIDAGYAIQGPAANKLGQNFARDCRDSTNPSNEDVFGEKPLASVMDGNMNIGRRGLASLFDYLGGTSPAGTELKMAKNYEELEAQAEKAGVKLTDMLDVPADQIKEQVDKMCGVGGEHGPTLPMGKKGRETFMKLLNDAMDATRTPTNLKRLKDITPPDGHPMGTTAVSLADQPTEREALLINEIKQADKFAYLPAFVMTRPVASALVARRDELKAEGKDFDVKVLCDPGVYPDGGTPNEYGVKYLEDHDMPVRWALLPRSHDHDRKIHAKEMITDKGEMYGSTNFSSKGMTANWEHSGITHFDPKDPDSIKDRDAAVARFQKLWDYESYECNTKDLATLWKTHYDGKDKDFQIEDSRHGVVKKVIAGIEAFEKETATFVQSKANDPQVAKDRDDLVKGGMDPGEALINAVEHKMGTESFYDALHSLPSMKALNYMKPRKPVNGHAPASSSSSSHAPAAGGDSARPPASSNSSGGNSWRPNVGSTPRTTFTSRSHVDATGVTAADLQGLQKLLEDGSPKAIAQSKQVVQSLLQKVGGADSPRSKEADSPPLGDNDSPPLGDNDAPPDEGEAENRF